MGGEEVGAGPACRIEHSTLAPGGRWSPREAPLSDRARLGVALEAAGLLSLCEVAGCRLADGGLSAGRIDEAGRLRGLTVSPGTFDGSLPALAGFLGELFGGNGTIAGRGEARRAARELQRRWAGALDGGSADRAVTDLLDEAPFLRAEAFAAAREAALLGRVRRGERTVTWHAGRGGERPAGERGLDDLIGAGRWRQAVDLIRERPEVADGRPLEHARALLAVGRAERALEVLHGVEGLAAEAMRADARDRVGELGAARESIRRIEALGPTGVQRVEHGELALRILVNAGEPDAAREWAAAAIEATRGGARRAARHLAALAAIDRGDLENARRLMDELEGPELEPRWRRLALETARAWAWATHDAGRAARLAAEALRAGRRRMGYDRAGRLWNQIGVARSLSGDFAGAERALGHASRLLRRCDGSLAVSLAAFNLADTRLRIGKLRDVESYVEASARLERRKGNIRGQLETELLSARHECVVGEWERAAARCAAALEEGRRRGQRSVESRLAVLRARALGWLGRAGEAREALGDLPLDELSDLEPEERPFALALAGRGDDALGPARECALEPLVQALLAGDPPAAAAWAAVDQLHPYRRARMVLDAELLAPGSVPAARRAEAAAIFRRLGAVAALRICERSDAVVWEALGAYFGRPAGEPRALEALLTEVGHPEAALARRGAAGETPLAGPPPRPGLEETVVELPGGDEIVLRAATIDAPLRALLALLARDLPPTPTEAPEGGSPLAGESAALRSAVRRLERFAATDLPVLVLGENGTGKELAAGEVHRRSERRRGPFVPVNCAGLSETLLLSELFGHARGAFTGADQPRAGVFEAGRGGTVFLDEIGDLPLAAQGSLLRVLQEKEIRRLGESMPRTVDVRIVAATNRPLADMVAQGSFRQDLYYRLKVATVVLPPLRERGADVALLTERFVAELERRGLAVRLSAEARRALARHDWPGNVRELKNRLEAAAALCEDGVVRPEQLELERPSGNGLPEGGYHAAVEAYRHRLLLDALKATGGSQSEAARRLGVTRQYVSQFVRKNGLEIRSG